MRSVPYEGGLRLWGLVVSADGTRVVRGDVTGVAAQPDALGSRLADLLRQRGAVAILEEVFAATPDVKSGEGDDR